LHPVLSPEQFIANEEAWDAEDASLEAGVGAVNQLTADLVAFAHGFELVGVDAKAPDDGRHTAVVGNARVVALPVGRHDCVDERPLQPESPHGERAAQGAAGLDRKLTGKPE